MFPAGVSIRKASGIRSQALSSREPFLLVWFIHNIKQCVTEYINSFYSSSLFQLFTKACTCCTLFLYTAGPSHVLMGEEHNSLCWPDSSSSTHFLLVSHYFCFCQLSVVHLPRVPRFFALTFCPHLNSKLVFQTLLFLLFLNHPILVYSVSLVNLRLNPNPFLLTRQKCDRKDSSPLPTEPQCPFLTTQVHYRPVQVTAPSTKPAGRKSHLKWLLSWLLTLSLEA